MVAKRKRSARSVSKAPAIRLDAVTSRHAAVLSQIWFNHNLSRSDLHQRSGTRLRTIGSLVEDLVKWGIVQEGLPRSVGVGRPQVPLSIDGTRRNMLGVSLTANRVVVAKSTLDGRAIQSPTVLKVKRFDDLVPTAARMIREHSDLQTLAIGIGLTGFVDDAAGEWLLSAAHPLQDRVSLKPLSKAANDIPVYISNELHAMSAAARLAGRLPRGDSLLIHLDDGRIAASILIDGKPNRGSVMAANELGHTTMPVKVARCYCGQMGCIERIFSSQFLRSHKTRGNFASILASGLKSNPQAMLMVDLLSRTVANAINLVRPATVILSSPFGKCQQFVSAFEVGVARYAMSILHQRMKLEWQLFDSDESAMCAASLPMARIMEQAAR